jgi:hypothetical protein
MIESPVLLTATGSRRAIAQEFQPAGQKFQLKLPVGL